VTRKLSAAIAALGLAVAAGGIAACFKQRQGERCQVESDCEEGLTCNKGKDPSVCDDEQSGMAIDAELPPDAPPDAPDAPPI
jgi:hypothetical protein